MFCYRQIRTLANLSSGTKVWFAARDRETFIGRHPRLKIQFWSASEAVTQDRFAAGMDGIASGLLMSGSAASEAGQYPDL